MQRFALDIDPRVEQASAAVQGGDCRHNRRTIDARQGPQDGDSQCQHCPGVPSADDRASFPSLDQLKGDLQRRVRFVPECRNRRLPHINGFASVPDCQQRGFLPACLPQLLLDPFLVPNQEDSNAILLGG